MDRSEKQSTQLVRSERQVGPLLGSLVFLLAANLIAKGALGLSSYQAQAFPNNVQGSLYLTLNNAHSNQPEQVLPHYIPLQPILFPYPGFATTTPKPITQQIVNIGEPFYDEIINNKDKNSRNGPQLNDIDDIIASASDEILVTTKPDARKAKVCDKHVELTTESTIEDQNVEVLIGNGTNGDIEFERQINTTTPSPVTNTTLVTMMTTQTQTTATTRVSNVTQSPIGTNTTGGYGYGPYTGNENISITYAPPTTNTTGNISGVLTPPGNVTGNTTMHPPPLPPPYHYFPSGNYGPSNGYENISIAYGPPIYQKPFISSPEDTFLTQQQYYNQFYGHHTPPYSHFSDLFKYNDAINRFYNKHDYHYPSFYDNYLGK